jgi:4-hydroxyphenylpyruvate dioxygenase
MTASAFESAKVRASGLGIEKLLGLHYYVHDLERSRRFYVDALDFAEIGCSSESLERDGRQRSTVFSAGEIVIACSAPLGKGGRADRYLDKHPDGIGTIAFQVRDIQRAFDTLEARGGTPISEIQRFRDAGGELATFSITTPFGDTTFRFMQSTGYRTYFPGMLRYDTPRGGRNHAGFTAIDHVTSNFQTMQPALLWLEHVLGFSPLWEVEFHTRDVMQQIPKHEVRDGSGLRSKVFWDPESGIKLANNEPYRPAFKSSQINVFHEQNRGDGVQHAALATQDITHAVRTLKARGVHFMPTPHAYYEQLPARLHDLGIERLDEDLGELEELQVLVDGSGPAAYLLQIFLEDSAGLYGSAEAGPFFYELIQRKGDTGFGAGNFRALFESIEREQREKGVG